MKFSLDQFGTLKHKSCWMGLAGYIIVIVLKSSHTCEIQYSGEIPVKTYFVQIVKFSPTCEIWSNCEIIPSQTSTRSVLEGLDQFGTLKPKSSWMGLAGYISKLIGY